MMTQDELNRANSLIRDIKLTEFKIDTLKNLNSIGINDIRIRCMENKDYEYRLSRTEFNTVLEYLVKENLDKLFTLKEEFNNM